MIRKWLNGSQHNDVSGRHEFRACRNGGVVGQFEQLEEKRCLAFVGFFNGITLDLVQTFDDGDVIIDNSGTGGAFRVDDNSGTLTFVDATNVTVTMLDNTANQLNFNINTSHTGNVQLNLGDGPRDVVFSGSGIPGIANTAGGDFEVNAGSGPQFINLAPNTLIPVPFQTVGSATFDLGDGFDTVYNNENFVRIGGNLNLTGVNLFRYTDFLFPVPLNADLMVGGDLIMDTSNESTESFLVEGGTFHDDDPMMPQRSIIGGNFVFTGGDDIDHINLNDTYVVGDLIIDLGEGIPFFGDPQSVITTLTLPPILGGPYGQIDGNIEITAGDSNLGNRIVLNGAFNGDTVIFNGGDLADEFTYSLLGPQADITASMGAGDDTFTLGDSPFFLGVNVLDVDFGNDPGDEFVNNWGQFTFDSDLTNFHWFDHQYTVGDNTLEMTQLINTGDITIDNDGGVSGIDWQLFTGLGGVGSTTSSGNLILNMLDNTGNDVDMDLNNPVVASITMNLGNGNRNINFVGTSNNPLRDLVINADLGVQNVELSVNAPLAVATLNIDLGQGFDTVDDDANNLMISEDLVLTGVNLFENDGNLTIARFAVIDVSGETQDTLFANNANMFVGSNFVYVGGDGRDEIRLNSAVATSISGNVQIDVGNNVSGGTQEIRLDSANTFIGGNLTVISTAATNPDNFLTDAGTTLNGNIVLDLGDGTNDALLVGVFGGNTIMYTGGNGVDNVIFGTTGSPADVTVSLGGNDDVFTLLAVASIQPDTLIVDFGGGNDTFVNLYGPFDFDAQLLNLNGVSHNYDFDTDTLVSTQISVTATLTVDNNGPGQAIRFIDGGTSILTPVTNLTVNMLDDSGTDLNLRLDNPLAGDLAVNLGDGFRDLNLDGTSNSIGGSLTVTGGANTQRVEVAVNTDLSVGSDALFDLGAGTDFVDEDGNNINVPGNLGFVGVNSFQNNGILTIGGNFSVDTTGETVFSSLDDDHTITVGGDFTYAGGDGQDQITLNGLVGGIDIAGNALINVGDNVAGGTQFVFFNAAGSSVAGNLTIISTSAVNPDSMELHPAFIAGGDLDIDLGGGPNTAIIRGVFGGSSIAYTGGGGVDDVTLGTTGNPANAVVVLGAGDDIFTLEAGTSIAPGTLTVDFGDNDDTLVNNYGLFDFSFALLGLDGFDHSYIILSDTLTSSQVSDRGPVTVDNNGTTNSIRFINGGINELRPVTNLNINMLSNSGTDLNLSLDNAFSGDLAIDLGDGNRTLTLDGLLNTVDGSFTLTGGSGEQAVNLADNADLTLNNGGSVNLGTGLDTVGSLNNLLVTGDFAVAGVNLFGSDSTVVIAGTFSMTSIGDDANSIFAPASLGFMTVDFIYNGGNVDDSIFLTSSTIAGTTTINGGDGDDSVFTSPLDTFFGDDILIGLGGGTNSAQILGGFGGSNIKYNGGNGSDNVSFGTTGNLANVNIKLSSGDDNFTLESGAAISPATLRVDFGGGDDTFVNNFGAFTFDAKLLNWHGYSRFYDLATDGWNIQQVMDTGPVTIDNNGAGDAIRLVNGFTTEMTPATNIRLIMLANTNPGVTVDFDSPHAGDLIIQLRDGFREVNFTGTSNTFGGLLRIEASENVQNVHVAVNADLNVGANLVFNGRNAIDSIDEGTHNINVGGTMILRNVNVFENNNTLTVAGNFGMNNLLDGSDTYFYNLGTINIGGNLTFLGGDGVEDVFHSGTANIGDFAYFDVGLAFDPARFQRVILNGGFNTVNDLGILAGTSFGGNDVATDAAASIGGNIAVNFGASASFNRLALLGTFGGTTGTVLGGSFVDQVTLGASASNMSFAALLGDGDDIFTVEATTSLQFLYLDFGNGNDLLVDNLGMPWPFPSTIGNLP